MGSDQKRAFLAVALSAVVLFGWQAMFGNQFVQTPEDVGGQPSENQAVTAPAKPQSPSVSTNTQNTAAPAEKPMAAEKKSFEITNGDNFVRISNDLTIEGYKSAHSKNPFSEDMGSEKPFKVQLLSNNQAIDLLFNFTINEAGNGFRGMNDLYGIEAIGSLDEKGRLSLALNSKTPYLYRLLFYSTAYESSGGSMIGGPTKIRQFAVLTQDVDRITLGDDSDPTDATVQWAGIDFNYHLFSFVFNNKTLTRYRVTESGYLTLDLINPVTNFAGSTYYLEKAYDDLKLMGNNLHLSVDFGFFGIIAVPILHGLQFFYKWLPNYGIAIILLTILIRLITFPLQYKSYKSMKKMQVVQPELQKLKEKYKDDPQRMQRETMELFKKAGANPMGGCFPMLLQMPVFFAFYQVLYNATELVGAPFYFWINDLSVKDPFFVLPVLMGLSMLAQSKLNPSAGADPTQKKVMMFMPLIFTFIMKDLPAGLNLYIFVSTLFAIVQQLFVYKTTD